MPLPAHRPDRPSRTCCLDGCTLAHCRRSRGAPKKPGPTSPGDRLPKNATHTFDPQKTLTVSVALGQVFERNCRSTRRLAANYSASVAVGTDRRQRQQPVGQRPSTFSNAISAARSLAAASTKATMLRQLAQAVPCRLPFFISFSVTRSNHQEKCNALMIDCYQFQGLVKAA